VKNFKGQIYLYNIWGVENISLFLENYLEIGFLKLYFNILK